MMRKLVIVLLALVSLGVFGAEAWTHYRLGRPLSLPMLGISIVAAALAGWLADRPETEAFATWLVRAGRDARQVAPPPSGGAP
jgi:hypothetical protein